MKMNKRKCIKWTKNLNDEEWHIQIGKIDSLSFHYIMKTLLINRRTQKIFNQFSSMQHKWLAKCCTFCSIKYIAIFYGEKTCRFLQTWGVIYHAYIFWPRWLFFRSCIILQVENCNIFELLLQNLLSSHQQYIYTFIEVVCILGRFEQQGLLIAWGSVFYLLYNLNKENGAYSFVSSFCTWYCVDDSISTISSFLIKMFWKIWVE